VGVGAGSEGVATEVTRDAIAWKREVEASARIRATTTIVPIAIATPMQSAATTEFDSVSFPSWSV
jgi:hypothetical protein